ncbi:tail completion protein gp17 [Sandarakinorhabdus limnophila]|uniref:tail completion protein gp17 n=1 Tax=Sandarakinorhabdus limnophila TaxID=210512 RepID=UPI0026EAF515|nr:DUF3168 domain-containing protein [Sandarakinorhabdus limnophila]MCM0031910.1 DUF3168 domain-containing protein [Sandarakinorhabdus limnophila]
MMAAGLAMQKAVVAALADVPGLAGVFDGPPADAAAPYAVIGPGLVTDAGTKTEVAHDHRMLVTIWDDRPGGARLQALLGAAEVRLRALSGRWDGHRIVNARLVRAGVNAPADGWRPGVIEMRLRSEQI